MSILFQIILAVDRIYVNRESRSFMNRWREYFQLGNYAVSDFGGDSVNGLLSGPSFIIWMMITLFTLPILIYLFYYYRQSNNAVNSIFYFSNGEECFRFRRFDTAMNAFSECISLIKSVKLSHDNRALLARAYHYRARSITEKNKKTINVSLNDLTNIIADHEMAIKLQTIVHDEEKKIDPTSSADILASYYYYYGHSLERAQRLSDAVKYYKLAFELDPFLTKIPTVESKEFQKRIDGIEQSIQQQQNKVNEQIKSNESTNSVETNDASENNGSEKKASPAKKQNKKKRLIDCIVYCIVSHLLS